MIQKFEQAYYDLVFELVYLAKSRQTRNGLTTSVFGRSLTIPVLNNEFPLLHGRTIYTKGILGEFAAIIRGPKCVEDFQKWGCNYWKLWADEDGKLDVDYGNAWLDFDGVNQLEELVNTLKTDPTNRRMIVSGWRPNRLKDLSLPCCHYGYQFYVCEDNRLHMIWTQRSVDVMVGLPSDIVLAATWLIALAYEVGLAPGTVKMDFGDCHIYEEHKLGAEQYLDNVLKLKDFAAVRIAKYNYNPPPLFNKMTDFHPAELEIYNYSPVDTIKFKLKE